MHPKKANNGEMPNKLLGESLFWLGICIFIFVPIVNNLVIQTILISINGNIAYKGVSPIMEAVAAILSVISAYAGVGLLTVALAYFGFKNAKGVVILSLFSHVVAFLASVMCYAFLGGIDYERAIFMLGTDMLAGIIVYLLIFAAVSILRASKKKKGLPLHPELKGELIGRSGMFSYIFVSVGTYFGVQLAIKLYDMISAFIDPAIGLPNNLNERIYWVTEYLTLLIYGAIGYFTALALCYLCKYYLRHFEKRTRVEPAAKNKA